MNSRKAPHEMKSGEESKKAPGSHHTMQPSQISNAVASISTQQATTSIGSSTSSIGGAVRAAASASALPLNIPLNSSHAVINNLDMLQLQSIVNNAMRHQSSVGNTHSSVNNLLNSNNPPERNKLNNILMGNVLQQQRPPVSGLASLHSPLIMASAPAGSLQGLLHSISGNSNNPQLQTIVGSGSSNPSSLLENFLTARPPSSSSTIIGSGSNSSALLDNFLTPRPPSSSNDAPLLSTTDNLLSGILNNITMQQQSNALITNNSSLQMNHPLQTTVGGGAGGALTPLPNNHSRANNGMNNPSANYLSINILLNPASSLENIAREEAGGASSSCNSIITNDLGPSGALSALDALQQNNIKSDDAPALENALNQNKKCDDANDHTITHMMKCLADGAGGGQDCVHLLSSDEKMTTGNVSNTFMAAGNNNALQLSQDVPSSSSSSLMNRKPAAMIPLTTAKDSIISHSAASDVCDPITIQEWMDKVTVSSDMPYKEAYILSALELALALTRKLTYLIDSRIAISPEDVATEKVLVYMERGQRPFSSFRDPPSINGVKFPGESSVTLLLSQQPNDTGTLQPRAACVLLGKLLLQIFTQNQSISLSSAEQTPQNKDRGSNSDISDTNGVPAPPPKKRKMPALASDSISSNKAHNLLLELEMPLSICQLVCDLLDAKTEGPTMSSTSLTSMDEVLFDLEQMKTNPASFLFDRTCPQGALDDTQLFICTDSSLVGREKEMSALLNAKAVCMESIDYRNPAASSSVQQQQQRSSFHCEAAFLSGFSGSGKSSLIHSLTSSCEEDQWFVIGCKFDKQAAPHTVLFRALDDFFGKWVQECMIMNSDNLSSSMISSFRKACRSIAAAMDEDGLDQLSDLVPNVAKMFPILAAKSNNNKNDCGISSMDKVGSAQKRLQNLFHVVLKSLCSAGRPVLFVIDDLQWSDTFITEALSDFVVCYMYGGISSVDGGKSCGDLFIVGAYRSNEVGNDVLRMIEYIEYSRKVNVTTLTIGELTNDDVTKLISTKLCLPWRYTRELAGLVHSKTRGNPFFIIQFLRTLVQNKLLEFSILSRRWMWDCDCVEMQIIPDGVAEMLTASFNQLPSEFVQTMKIVSCLGYQVETSVINILNLKKDILPCCMLDQMQLAVKEGFIEKAGPLYQFTHDIIKETVYELIPADNRGALHKAIGLSLLRPRLNDATIHLLAVDQINTYLCNDGDPAPEEHTMFASINAQAAKFALASSSFQQAPSYINAGMKLLQTNHWVTQYDLSLSLFEMSAIVSCVHGDNATMSDCLSEILSHAKSFDDSLTGAGFLAKLLASNSKYNEARSNCFEILSNLGEVFPAEVDLPLVLNELSNVTGSQKNISHDLLKALPRMTDKTKLNAMKFLNMLCMYSVISKPLLLPILSCRMVKLTLQYGFCDDSIVGIATAGYSVFLFTDELSLAFHLGSVSERLVEESPKKNVLRSRLSFELLSTLRIMRQKWHSALSLYPEYYNSAMLSGDVENAMVCRFMFSAGRFWTGASCISTAMKELTMCMKDATKYDMNMVKYGSMAILNCCSILSGKCCSEEIKVKTLDELDAFEDKTSMLIWQIFYCKLFSSFWMHGYAAVVELSEEYTQKYPSAQQKRILHVLRTFNEGVAYLSLARCRKRPEWIAIGEKAVKTFSYYETTVSKDNFENKSKLLQAEFCYLNGDLNASEAAYQASIRSACEQKFIHEEALAYEQYGNFLIENHNAKQGLVQLRLAVHKYKEWGAMKKVHNLQVYIDSVVAADSIC